MKFTPPITPTPSAPTKDPPPRVMALCNHPGPQSLEYVFSFATVPLLATELSNSFSFIRASSVFDIYACVLFLLRLDNEMSWS